MYWVAVGLLIAFGIVAIFSIGAPFLLLGVVLAVLAPWRRRLRVIAPAVAGVLGLTAGYVLIAPLRCTSISTDGGTDFTTCSNLLGIDYSAAGSYNPSLLPALVVGLAAGGIAAGVTRWVTARPRSATPRPSG